MPALSPTMSSGNVGTWQKQVGDSVSSGDVLVEIETDKAQVDFECNEEGYLAKILVESGEKNVDVGKAYSKLNPILFENRQPIAILVEDNENIQKFEDYVPEQSSPPPKAETAEKDEKPPKKDQKQDIQKEEPQKQQKESTKSPISSDRILASPVARKLAAERGISLDQVDGTGPKNRIIKADILNFVAPATEQPTPSQHAEPSSSYTDIPLSNMRKIIASRLSESKQLIPHYYLTIEVEVDKLLELREVLNKDSDGKYKISVNDFVIKSSASALMAMPEVNSTWHNDFIRQYNHADISVATATPTGLITPIIRNAQAKGLETISNQTKDLAIRAREGKLGLHEYQGGSFTISNLGMYGIKNFTAIINPPHACILAVGTTQKKLIPDSSKETGYRIATTMHVTLSCDHRVVDGALGAQWLRVWRTYIENPLKLLL
ncbi:2-oxoacid dehydrogenases acyltransferase-domain-containing protein [Gigaspora rosea]|uniref:Acetyltransferase component of pyruvate dehydrogenase complex n=1 Tax=Gigaspora rosea TaxID=44941 RepID=A0A397UT78_9GLOM|nr:2-oxoacid dehydrogenases acyltransferase-domain-containing protein [Gigaspora rosea]